MAVDKSTLHRIPKQKIPFDQKDQEWKEETVDAYIELSFFNRNSGYGSDIKKLYDYYNGHKHSEDYRYVLQPYGGAKRKNVPADLKRYNIIKPIVDVLIGEKARRPDNASVIAVNSDATDIKKEKEQEAIVEALSDEFYSILQKRVEAKNPQQQQQQQQQDQITVEEKIDFFQRNYTDIRSELGQHAWNFIKQYCEVYDKNQKLWKDFLVAGEEYAFIGTNNNEPEYRVVNPLDIDYDKDPELEFVEDGDWCVLRRFMTASSIIDKWHKELTPEDVDYLEDPEYNRESFLSFSSDTEAPENDNDRLIEVMEVYWKSFKKIGFLTYIDEMTGKPEERIVDENYEPSEEESVEWLWVNESWQGVRIDDNIYIDTYPCENQRRSLDNPSRCKLPVNGRKYSNRNSANISLVMMGIPYQLIYDIYKYRLELSIAKSKDIVAEFDLSLIPGDWGIDEFMHYLEVTGIAWMDYNQEGKKLNPQAKKALDLSIRTIEQYIVLLDSVKQEWFEASGVPRQRQGNIDSYDGKGVTEQSIIQSSYITEDYFRKHNRFEERNAQGLVDNSQEIWINGKKGTYLMPDGTQQFFELDGQQYSEAEYGVFISSARKDIENLDRMKNMTQAFAQNQGDMSTIASILESDSFAEIKRKIELAEDARAKQEAAIAEMEKEAKEMDMSIKQAEMEGEERRNIRDNQTKIEEALIQAEAQKDVQNMRNTVDQAKNVDNTQLEQQKINEERRANRVEEALKRVDLSIKRTQTNKPKNN